MSKKRVFIIHGWDGNPNEAWLKWLREELQKEGVEVVAPQMPNADEPKMDEWVPFLSNLVGQADENTFFVGHSMGCQTIMRYLETIYPQKVGGVVLVAGFFHLQNLEGPETEIIAKPWLETPIDFKKVRSTTDNFNVILSDDDNFVPLSDKEIFKSDLDANVLVLHNKGHFTDDDDAAQIPEILDFI